MITQTLGPDKGSCNTFNTPVFLVPINPIDACLYVPDNFSANIESIFIPDAKKDMERSMATVERNIRREEELSKNVATDDLLLFGAATENTTADLFVAKQFKDDQVREGSDHGEICLYAIGIMTCERYARSTATI